MPYILIRHQVEDFDAWKSLFDDHAETRAEAGSKGGQLFRTTEDPEDLVALMEWDSVENARSFAESSDLAETMREAGVVDEPEVAFLESIEEFST